MNTQSLLSLVVIIACTTSVADAQNGVAYPYAGCCWYGYGSLATYSSSPVPYFSLHPPVYYSYRVARTYGYSPFAYPPGVITPGPESARLTIAQSVYAVGEAGETSAARPEGQPPLRIDNPFVDQPDRRAGAQGRGPAGGRPQVVFPTTTVQSAASTATF
jgi:hypothetical protein